eukprot:scaffold78964_cov54-Phaeocystis_antarctica.AAC.1
MVSREDVGCVLGARGLHASAPAKCSLRGREACRSSAWHRSGAQVTSLEQARRARLARRVPRRAERVHGACRSGGWLSFGEAGHPEGRD